MDKYNKYTGLSPQENIVMARIIKVYEAYNKLETQHQTEKQEVCDAVHKIQDLLAVRVCRRMFPEFWECKPKKEVHNE